MASAASDLREKIRLERRLSREMRGLFGAMGRQLETALGPVGQSMVPNLVAVWSPVLQRILMTHYARTTRALAWKLSAAMPVAVRPSDLERRVIAIEMGRVFSRRSVGQARLILETAQRRVIRSVGRASAAIAAPDSGLTAADLARVAARDWVRRQVVQARAVATVETQTAAETAKGVEAARLLGGSSPVFKAAIGEAKKLWVTQGDSKVRTGQFDHLEADGQRVPVSQPFEVSGQRLRWPGDWSLGATGENIYGCRCSAVYEAESVAELRSGFMERLLLDLQRFVQTESDVVVSMPFML